MLVIFNILHKFHIFLKFHKRLALKNKLLDNFNITVSSQKDGILEKGTFSRERKKMAS